MRPMRRLCFSRPFFLADASAWQLPGKASLASFPATSPLPSAPGPMPPTDRGNVKKSANSLHQGSGGGYRTATSARPLKEALREGAHPVPHGQHVLGFPRGYLPGDSQGVPSRGRKPGSSPATLQDHRGEGDRRPAHHAGRLPEGAHPERREREHRPRAATDVRRELILSALVACAAAMAGCDEGTPTLSATGDGPAPRPVWMSPARDETGVGLRQSIRIQFDRYLLPTSAVRQSICLQTASPTPGSNDCPGGLFLTPEYDPVDRVLAYVPTQDLLPNQRYTVRILAPRSEDDVTGIRAFDGVPMEAEQDYGFTTGNSTTPTLPEPVRDVDFCFKDDLFPLPANVCSKITAIPTGAQRTGPRDTLSGCAAGAPCHGLPNANVPPPQPGYAYGSAFSLTTDPLDAMAGIPTAVQQLVANSVV